MEEPTNSDELAALISAEEVVELALTLGRIDSPSGAEHDVSDYVFEWCREHDLAPRRVRAVEGLAANIVAGIPGHSGGRSLLLNSHLDTAVQPNDTRYFADPNSPVYRTAWRDGDDLVGIGIVNDKGPMAAWLVAAATLRRHVGSLAGDIVLTAVTGEIGFEPVDELVGLENHGKDFGSRYIATRGALADYAIIAETTGFNPIWSEPGKAFFRIEVFGRENALYTPYLDRPYPQDEHPNAIVHASTAIGVLESWADQYQQIHRRDAESGRLVPQVNIGAVRAGNPTQPILSPRSCVLYLDVRLPIERTPVSVLNELRALLTDVGINARVECYLFRRGYEAEGAEPVVTALEDATRREIAGTWSTTPHTASSMWRDINVWNEIGVPAVTFGPGIGTGGGNARLSIDELVTAAKIYLRTMIQLCS